MLYRPSPFLSQPGVVPPLPHVRFNPEGAYQCFPASQIVRGGPRRPQARESSRRASTLEHDRLWWFGTRARGAHERMLHRGTIGWNGPRFDFMPRWLSVKGLAPSLLMLIDSGPVWRRVSDVTHDQKPCRRMMPVVKMGVAGARLRCRGRAGGNVVEPG